jgi:hypothetical protein
VGRFFVVQPYGPNKGRDATIIYEAATVNEAFAEIDRLAAQMERTGVRPDTIEFVVADERGNVVGRKAN